MFTTLVFIAAFLLEGIGTYVSVIGLGHLFAGSLIVMIMAVALDVAKVVAVTFLYRHWKEIGVTIKSYMLAATFVLMVITSTGVFGFLSGEFQKAISDTNQQAVIIQALTDEQGRLQKRKEEIDKQIAQLPQNNVRGRRQLMQQFGPEVQRLNTRLAEIDKQLPELKVESISAATHVGPILYVSKAFDTTPEEAVKWIILIIIGVFDPLAIALMIAGNFLLARKKIEPENQSPTLDAAAPPTTVAAGEMYDANAMDFHLQHPVKVKKPPRKKVVPAPQAPEKVVIKPTPTSTPSRKVTTVMQGDKEVIKLQQPTMRSMLEDVTSRESLDISNISAARKTYED